MITSVLSLWVKTQIIPMEMLIVAVLLAYLFDGRVESYFMSPKGYKLWPRKNFQFLQLPQLQSHDGKLLGIPSKLSEDSLLADLDYKQNPPNLNIECVRQYQSVMNYQKDEAKLCPRRREILTVPWKQSLSPD